MRPVIPGLLVLLALTSPAIAEPESTVPELLREARHGFEEVEDGSFRLLIEFNNGRSQLVFLEMLEPFEETEILEIYSPVLEVTYPLDPALAKRLLTVAGTRRIGYFAIEHVALESEEFQPTVFVYHNLPLKGLTGDVLRLVIQNVADLADGMEQEQLGSSKDAF